jgi:hypothetical protein
VFAGTPKPCDQLIPSLIDLRNGPNVGHKAALHCPNFTLFLSFVSHRIKSNPVKYYHVVITNIPARRMAI